MKTFLLFCLDTLKQTLMHQTFGAFLVNGLSPVWRIVEEGQQASHPIHPKQLFSLWFELNGSYPSSF